MLLLLINKLLSNFPSNSLIKPLCHLHFNFYVSIYLTVFHHHVHHSLAEILCQLQVWSVGCPVRTSFLSSMLYVIPTSKLNSLPHSLLTFNLLTASLFKVSTILTNHRSIPGKIAGNPVKSSAISTETNYMFIFS